MTTDKKTNRTINKTILGLAITILCATTASTAFAQATAAPPAPPQYPPPPGPFWAPQPGWPPPVATRPPPPSAIAPNGEYVAPMSQTTQPTYVPQSVALSGPRVLKDYQDGDPIPYGYHRETRARKGAIIGGALALGIPYLYSGLIASAGADASSSGQSNKVADLYIPVLGPFLEMANTDSATLKYMLFLDGAAQAIGAALLVYGVYVPRPVLVRNDLAMVTVTPMVMGHGGNGVGLVGRF
jgi:hypothetical protein